MSSSPPTENTFCQEKPKTSQQKGAPIQEGKNINENKDNQDSKKEDLNKEVTEKVIDGVGEAAPLVAVSQEDEVKMLSLVVRPVDIAKLCQSIFRRQIALYSPCRRSVGRRHILLPLILGRP